MMLDFGGHGPMNKKILGERWWNEEFQKPGFFVSYGDLFRKSVEPIHAMVTIMGLPWPGIPSWIARPLGSLQSELKSTSIY